IVIRLPGCARFCVVTLILLVPLPAANSASTGGLLRVVNSIATPVPGVPIKLDAQQAQEVAVLIEFIRAYNAGRIGTALTLFRQPFGWSDCDYRRGMVIAGQGRASLKSWLQQRAADHDRLEVGSIRVGDVPVLGVTFKRRMSDT